MEEIRKSVPLGVKIISVLYIIGAAVIVLATLILGYNALFLTQSLDIPGDSGLNIPSGDGVMSLMIMIPAIFFVGIAVLSFFVGRGLWKGRNWARIVAIVYSALGILGGVNGLMRGNFGQIFGLLVSVIIGGYLVFNKDVKQAFVQ